MNRSTLSKIALQISRSSSFGVSLRIGPAAAVAKLAEHLSPQEQQSLRTALDSRREQVVRAAFALAGAFSRETGTQRRRPRGGEIIPRASWFAAGPTQEVGRWDDRRGRAAPEHAPRREPSPSRTLAPERRFYASREDSTPYFSRPVPRAHYQASPSLARTPETAGPFDPYGLSAIAETVEIGPAERQVNDQYEPMVDLICKLAEEQPGNQKLKDECNALYVEWLGEVDRAQRFDENSKGGSGGSGGSGGAGGSTGSGGQGGSGDDEVDDLEPDPYEEPDDLEPDPYGDSNADADVDAAGRPSDESGGGRSRIPYGVLHGLGHVGQVTPGDDPGGGGEGGGEGGKFDPLGGRRRRRAGGAGNDPHSGPSWRRQQQGESLFEWQSRMRFLDMLQGMRQSLQRKQDPRRGSSATPGTGPDDYMPTPEDPGGGGPRSRAATSRELVPSSPLAAGVARLHLADRLARDYLRGLK